MKNILSILAIILAASATGHGQRCPSASWVQVGSTCYYFVTSELPFFQAEQYCTYLVPGEYKAHLVSIEGATEHAELKAVIESQQVLKERDFWTSGNKIDEYVGWKWSGSNKPFGFTVWAPNEPNNSGRCVQMWSEQAHSWDDAPCDSPVNFICEVAAS